MLRNSAKRKILIFCSHYLPGYKAGGPIRSVKGLVELIKEDYGLYIVTLNHDFGDLNTFPDIDTNRWKQDKHYNIFYGSDDYFSLQNIKKIILDIKPDYIYVNSFFDPVFSIKIYLILKLLLENKVKLIIAPRGEFSLGALSLKKTKKKIFICTFRYLLKKLKPKWHASSEKEKSQILKTLPSVDPSQINIAVNIPDINFEKKVQAIEPGLKDRKHVLKVCFLGRISKMKNLKFALEVLNNVEHEVVFSIFGPQEDQLYWEECAKLINTMRDNVKIVVKGEIVHSKVQVELSKHDVFFLPTLGENFGHVIFEALASGLILIISDRTMWRDLKNIGVGWDIPLSNKFLFEKQINELALMTPNQIAVLRRRCRAWSAQWFQEQNFKMDYKNIFE
ncbi:glycosyltransferase family 4 protein [Planktomarina sp.]|nr:glycosyltransferase family 4 protein [Planktomarina sp.]